MPKPMLLKRTLSVLSATTLALGGAVLAVVPAKAAPVNLQARSTNSITADRLATMQVNGVVWSTDIAGNTIYAGGSFTKARPAGAAAGTSETTRNNLVAFNVTTGEMVSTFAPDLNGQVLGVAVSPDKSRVYVVGDFTTADGQARRRVAAYSTSTGALIASFNPVGVNARARSVTATNDTVYVGGSYLSAGSSSRGSLAAFRASDGALLPWAPVAERPVWGLATDGTNVYAAGQFTTINGQDAYGLAKINGTTGALDAAWKPEVRNGGDDAAVGSVRVQNSAVYGTTWHFGPGGNLEGTFKIPLSSAAGSADWVTDCHGDNYGTFVSQGTVYSASHAHYCGNMGGGFPQYPAWRYQHGQAWSDTLTGDILNEVHGYYNWAGKKQGPAMINWLPEITPGTVTGQGQAGWTVTGNDDYIVVGGEFPRVNGTAQAGLVRFGKRPVAPGTQGPLFVGGTFVPQISAQTTTSSRIVWPAAYDRDDLTLTYRLYRNNTLINTQAADSNWWTLPALGYVDTGVTAGGSYSYRLTVSDPGGNLVYSTTVGYTQPGSVSAANSYAQAVTIAGATLYWPLNDTRTGSPMAIRDRAGFNDGVADNDVNAGQDGAITGDAGMTFSTAQPSQPWGRVYAKGVEYAPDTFTTQAWIKTNSTTGGRIFGFGDVQVGNSGHRDRHIYMTNAGKLVFGVRAQNGSNRTVVSGKSYNDSQWHMVTATMSAQGMQLYVDGVRVARRSDTTQGEKYLGYWRVQGDSLSGWTSQPSNVNFIGSIDEVAAYPTALDQSTILAQYVASGRTSVVPQAPADAYGAAVYGDDPDLFWRFAESTGTTAADSGRSLNDGTYREGVALGRAGVITGNTAAQFDGTNDLVSSNGQFSNPTVFSTEAWFQTTSTTGGKIVGFGNAQSGNSASYDRHVYMLANGRVVFGVWTGQASTIETTAAFNDGGWHHVVATQSSDGMKLYIDGVLQGTNPQTQAQSYDGYWRVGGDNSWSGNPYFKGLIDEAAVYSYALPQGRVLAHYQAGVGGVNQAPTAAFTISKTGLHVSVDGSVSSDPDGTISSYEWNFGDGHTEITTSPTTDHTYAAGGHFVITLKVTDNRGGTNSTTREVDTTTPSNQDPTAAFTTSVSKLKVTFTEGSTDPDGTIASYLWDFGDGTTSTAKNPPVKTYVSAGTFTVTLTVIDDVGETDAVSHDVTTVANVKPTAAFTSSASGLAVGFDAGTSTDSDGTISSYAWNFGDGNTGSGVGPNHTYAAAGSYRVELTVTDSDGATGVLSKTVDVTGPTQIAADDFNRMVSNGWGGADIGGAWTVNSAGSFAVSGGNATLTTATSATRTAFLNAVSARDVDITTSLSYDKAATGSGIYSAVVGRRIGTSDYRVTLTTTSTKVQVQLRRSTSGAETSLTTATLSGGTLAANSNLLVRFQVSGVNATTLRAKVWRNGDSEPTAWTTTTTDSTAALQAAGGVGLYGYLSGSATNSPVTAKFASFEVKPA
ncbi:MAG: PKD domain-containing protein [Micropruina sp.]